MNAKKQKKELPSFQLFRLTIDTAKTSAHISFIFVSPLLKKRLKCYQRISEKPVYSPFFSMLLFLP